MIHYFYRVKRLLRNRILFFWSIVFPMVLAAFFKMAFSSIVEKEWAFETIPVAVAAQDGSGRDGMLISFLEEMENEDTVFFEVIEAERSEAEKLLRENHVTAVILTGEETSVLLRENGLSATVVKTVLDGYLQSREIFMDAAANGKLREVTQAFATELPVLSTREFKGTSKDPTIQYFQALLAMASLYGAMYGLLNAKELNPGLSAEAARRVAAPVPRLSTALTDLAAAFTVQYLQFLILIAYFILILRIDFGRINAWLFLAGAVHSLLGVSVGYFIGCAVRKKPGVQQAVMMSSVMLSSFLAGLMVGDIRIEIELAAPWLNRINPATLIANSLHALCIMGDMRQYALCMAGMLLWCAALFGGSIAALALHQSYEKRGIKGV